MRLYSTIAYSRVAIDSRSHKYGNTTYNVVYLEYSSHGLRGERERRSSHVQRLQHVLLAHVCDAAAAHVHAGGAPCAALSSASVRRAQLRHSLDGVQT